MNLLRRLLTSCFKKLEVKSNVQKTFDKIIAAKLYPSTKTCLSSSYMCISLAAGIYTGVITRAQADRCDKAIKSFLKGSNTLQDFLESEGVEATPELCLAVYTNWDRRYEAIENNHNLRKKETE